MANCLFCYQILEPGLTYHTKCCKKFFGTEKLPELELDKAMLEKLAEETVNKRIAITGAQPKLSLDLQKKYRCKSTNYRWFVGKVYSETSE